MKNNKDEEKTLSLFQQFKNYIFGLQGASGEPKPDFAKKGAPSSMPIELSFFQKIQQTGTYKVLAGKGVGRGIGIGFMIAGAAGLMAIAPAAIAVGAVAMTAAVLIDSYMVYKTKTLYKEAKMLRDNRVALHRQKDVFKKDHSLEDILKNDLIPTTKKTDQSKQVPKEAHRGYFTGIAVSVLGAVGPILNNILSGNRLMLMINLTLAVTGAKGEAAAKHSMSEARDNLRDFIAKEKGQDYSPAYKNKKDLKNKVNQQRIQTMALEKLSQEKGTDVWPAEKVQNRFREISKDIADRANNIQEGRSPFIKYGRKIFKNVVTAHNPFSRFTDAEKLDKKIHSHRNITHEDLEKKASKRKVKDMKKLAGPIKNGLVGQKDVQPQKPNIGKKPDPNHRGFP